MSVRVKHVTCTKWWLLVSQLTVLQQVSCGRPFFLDMIDTAGSIIARVAGTSVALWASTWLGKTLGSWQPIWWRIANRSTRPEETNGASAANSSTGSDDRHSSHILNHKHIHHVAPEASVAIKSGVTYSIQIVSSHKSLSQWTLWPLLPLLWPSEAMNLNKMEFE